MNLKFEQNHSTSSLPLLQDYVESVSNEMKQNVLQILVRKEELLEECQVLLSKLNDFERLVVVGTGGSTLGSEAFINVNKFEKKIYYLDCLDPAKFDYIFNKINFNKTAFLFISKSGSTFETVELARIILNQLKCKDLNLKTHCFFITQKLKPDSELNQLAHQYKIESYNFDSDISGRFSVLTFSSLVPSLFMGLDYNKICQGSQKAVEDKQFISKLSLLLYDLIHENIFAFNFWSYSLHLDKFNLWLRQLLSESLTQKGDDFFFPIYVPCRGSVDQHSYLQQIVSQAQKHYNFIVYAKDQDQDEASVERLSNSQSKKIYAGFGESKIKSSLLELDRVDEEVLSYLFTSWMLAVGVVAKLIRRNPFTQDEVEAFKKLF